jgi:hypothetical protein
MLNLTFTIQTLVYQTTVVRESLIWDFEICWWGVVRIIGLGPYKGSFMHGGGQLFSPTFLVKVERSLLKEWVALYALVRVWSRGERKK